MLNEKGRSLSPFDFDAFDGVVKCQGLVHALFDAALHLIYYIGKDDSLKVFRADNAQMWFMSGSIQSPLSIKAPAECLPEKCRPDHRDFLGWLWKLSQMPVYPLVEQLQSNGIVLNINPGKVT